MANPLLRISPTQVRVWGWRTWDGRLVLGWPTLIYGFCQPKFELGVATLGLKLGFRLVNAHIRILPTQIRVWGGELGVENLNLGWPTLIYGCHKPKFDFRRGQTWVRGGQPSYSDFVNSNSRLGWRTWVCKLGFGIANTHIRISQTQIRVWGGELGLGNLGWGCQPSYTNSPAQVRVWGGG